MSLVDARALVSAIYAKGYEDGLAVGRKASETDALVCDDLVSRAEAMAIIEDNIDKEYMTPMSRLYMVRSEISALPSADAAQGWIPCSERLPNVSDDYLCTIPLDADEIYTRVLTFHKGRFYEDDDEWGATYYDDVLAWMPLPAPYKGGGSE